MRFRLACGFACLAAAAAYGQDLSMGLLGNGSGWMAARNRVFRTSSAGLEWREITPPGTLTIHGVFFLDREHGWMLRASAAGALEMARSGDGGESWTAAAFGLSEEDASAFGGPAAIDFVDPSHGWAMLRRTSSSNFSFGMLFATADGGATWVKLPNPPLGDPVRFSSQRDGWLAGGPRHDQLYQTRDGGITWRAVRLAPPAGVEPSAAVRYGLPRFGPDGGTLTAEYQAAGGAAVALYEMGGGAAGQARAALPAPESQHAAVAAAGGRLVRVTAGANVTATDFSSETEGWMVTSEGHCEGYKTGCSQQQRLLATTDGGATFQDITPALLPAAAVLNVTEEPWSTIVGTGEGFDACDPTSSGLGTWFQDSPYRYVNVYIGGGNAACPQPGLSSSWVSTVTGQGWGLIPTWVGPQAPHPCTSCSGCSSYSSNTTTAASQGASQAKSAASKMSSIGLKGTIVYYDLEQYNESSSCSAATKAFVNAWVSELHALGYSAGVYGSPTNANSDWKSLSHAPDDVWLALWNNVPSVWNLSPLPNTYWPNNQRIHQYWCCPTQTYGGVSYNIDQDYLAGAVAK